MAHTARRIFLTTLRYAGLALLIATLVLLAQAWEGMGKSATGERLARMQRSAQWQDGAFENPQPLLNDFWGMLTGMLEVSEHATPLGALPATRIDPARFRTRPESGLRITWLGHASSLIEIDGARVLTDPVWSERTSPIAWLGPKRWYPPPIALGELPSIDAVVISHDHYDHLDHRTLKAMKMWPKTRFIVPLGVGAHLEYWGLPKQRIVEVDWWERVQVGALSIVCTPARHASGREVFDKDATLWAGYALIGAQHRVYFSGDTGPFPAMKRIGEELGPFDITMIETGQYHPSWPDWHIGPEQAVAAHKLVRGRAMLPIHWALLTLAYHGWTEPIERVLAEAKQQGVPILTPRPGESIEPERALLEQRWWPTLPFESAQERPIVSSGMVWN